TAPRTPGFDSKAQQRFEDTALGGVGSGLLDPIGGVGTDHPVERKPSGPVQADQLRDEVHQVAVALGDPFDAAPVEQEVDVVGAVRAHGWGPDHGQRTTHRQGVGGLTQQGGHTTALQGVGETLALGDVGQAFGGVFLLAVDDVCGAEFSGQVQSGGHDVDGDDVFGGGEGGRHDTGQAHRACTEDGDGVTCTGDQFVEDGARTGLDPATDGGQQREFVLVHGLDGHDTAHMGDAARGEGGLSEEAPTERVTRCGPDGGGAVGAGPVAVHRAEGHTVGAVSAQAGAAVDAGAEGEQHLVPPGHVDVPVTDDLHHTSPFVTEHGGHGCVQVFVAGGQVGVADPGTDHADQEFVGAWVLQLDVFPGECSTAWVDHCGS